MTSVDPELYTRWVQFGVFSPILRTHTTKNPESERRIWAYPEPYSEIMRRAFRLRYALEPYIYTEARQTYDTGVAFLHPLYYEWPEAEEAYTSKGEYVFGRNMLVAPVVKPIEPESQMAKESVWLPQGEWIEWATGRDIIGPAKLDRRFSIQQIPVYVRAGAIIPMQADMERSAQSTVDPLIVNIFPLADGQTSSYSLYEDDSKTADYTRGEAAWTDLSVAEKAGDLMVEIKPVRAGYRGMVAERGYQIRLPGDWPPSSVRSNGKPLPFAPQPGKPGWRYEGNTLTTIITVPRLPLAQAIHIRVHRSAALVSDRKDLDGFAGAMTRLRESYDTLNRAWPLAWSPDVLIDAVETGDRLSYHPESAEREIAHFHTVLAETIRQIENLQARADSPDMQKIMAAFGTDWSAELAQQRIAQYREIVKRGLLEAKDVVEQKSAD